MSALLLSTILAAASPSTAALEPARDALRHHDYARGAELLAVLADAGNAEAGYQLALLYLPRSNDMGLPADPTRACQLLVAAAAKGWAKAAYTLASQVESGICKETGRSAEEWSAYAESGGFKSHSATVEAPTSLGLADPATQLRRAAQDGNLQKLASLLSKAPADSLSLIHI